MKNSLYEQVSTYYGKTIQSTEDLKTNACCTDVAYPKHIKKILSESHDETISKYYGCGLTIPSHLKNLRILDLGSGSGRDCFMLSKLVGKDGRVYGIDMTNEQLDIANKHLSFHASKFGHNNVTFIKGNIEELDKVDIASTSLDLIVSNCVINHASNKKAVLQGAFDLLKEGGELYFSDVYADRRIPQEIASDHEIYGECLGGAMYWNDFLNTAKSVGFFDPHAVSSNKITIDDERISDTVGNINFYSITYRLIKLKAESKESTSQGTISFEGYFVYFTQKGKKISRVACTLVQV